MTRISFPSTASAAPAAEIDWTNAPFEAQEVYRQLTQGDATLGWQPDPTLECRIGLITAANNGTRKGKTYRKGDVVAVQITVYRHCEDGTYQQLITRDVDHAHEIIPELRKRRLGQRGYLDTMTEITEWNDSVDRDRSRAIQEAQAAHTEHLWSLVADRQNGRTTFRGLPGQNPDKQM